MFGDRAIVFDDRKDAGRRLAERLSSYRGRDVIVLALPRGGVEVGYEVARSLDAPLDVIVARKIGAPGQPELGIGAVAPGGVRILDPQAIRWLGVTDDQIAWIAAQEEEEMDRRLQEYRGNAAPMDLRGKTVILVDDGLATGVTARAAVEAVRNEGAREIVLAIPVCAAETAEAFRARVDSVVCVSTPPDFRAVGLWYRDFSQVTDEEVKALLERAHEFGDEKATARIER